MLKQNDLAFLWHPGEGVVKSGTVTSIVGSDYAYLNLEGPYMLAFLIKDTPGNRAKAQKFAEEVKKWRDNEPNVYALRNSFDL